MTENIFRKRDLKFKIGAILTVIFSIIVGILNIGILFLLGIPLLGLIAGIVLIWISNANSKDKLYTSLWSLPIIVLSFYAVYLANRAEPETFLIPQNFRGDIVIFYEESCGQKPVYENRRRVYDFSKDNILITNFKQPKGILNQEFYFLTETGERIPIPKKDVRDFNFKGRLSKTDNEPSRDEIFAFYSYVTLVSIFSAKYQSYVISNFRYFEKDEKTSWNELKELSDKSSKLLKQCRDRKNR